MLTYLLALVNPVSVGQQVLAVTFLTSVDWSPPCPALISRLAFSWLLSTANCPWDLPSLVRFRSRGRSRVQALCVGFAPKQTKGSSDWHPHPQKRMSPIVSHKAKEPSFLYYFTHTWREDSCTHIFPQDINVVWNANNLVMNLNAGHRVHFLQRYPLNHECLHMWVQKAPTHVEIKT